MLRRSCLLLRNTIIKKYKENTILRKEKSKKTKKKEKKTIIGTKTKKSEEQKVGIGETFSE